jgi:hypothetical protein
MMRYGVRGYQWGRINVVGMLQGLSACCFAMLLELFNPPRSPTTCLDLHCLSAGNQIKQF